MSANAIAVIESVQNTCAERGLQLTRIRRAVLNLILQADGPVKAYDLLDQLRDEHSNAAPPTVYRALDFLLENRFIHRLETLNAFVCCFHPEAKHSGQFLICEDCDEVTEVLGTDMAATILAAARARDFQPHKQVVEVYGLCSNCHEHPQPIEPG